jgi:hypothetical protein
VNFHLGFGPQLLTEQSMERLHEPASGDNYAMGWIEVQRSWADGTAWTHNGSNTMFYAVMWVAPNRDFAAVAMSNVAGSGAERLCDQAIVLAIDKYLD